MKTTGTFQTDAMLIPSCQSPRLVAPSPKKQRATRSWPRIFMERPTPAATGTLSPSMLTKATKFFDRSPMCMLPSLPRVAPVLRAIYCARMVQRHSTNEESSHVAMRWTNHVVLPQVDAATYRDRFLTAPDVYTTDNFSLTIEFPLDPELEFARELHVVQHIEKGLFWRKSDRRYGIPGERRRVRRIQLHWDLQNRRYSKDVSFFNSAS